MNYLEHEYKLKSIRPSQYKQSAQKFARLEMSHGLLDTLKLVTKLEEPKLADTIYTYGHYLNEVYGGSGGFYDMAFGIGLTALRKVSPQPEVPVIMPADWNSMMDRDEKLRQYMDIKTLETIGGIMLIEISNVNPGYVEGYQRAFGTPNLSPFLGFTGLGTAQAHDLIHFASIRE